MRVVDCKFRRKWSNESVVDELNVFVQDESRNPVVDGYRALLQACLTNIHAATRW